MSTDIETLAHSHIGASSLYRWAACPGSVRLSKDIPSKTSKYAEEGTIAHEAAAHYFQKGRFPEDFSSGNFMHEYPDMQEAVLVYINLIKEEWNEDKDENDVLLIEHRFHLKQIHEDAFGTGDCVMYKHKKRILKVFDYKHGKGHVVNVNNNPQLKYYGLGALLSLPKLKPITVESIIVQPRAYHEDGPIRREAYPVMDLFEFSGDLRNYIEETLKPDAKIVAGEHCHFCPAKPHCPLLHEKSIAVAQKHFTPVTLKDNLENLSLPELGKTLTLLDAIEAYCKGVREHAYQLAESGHEIPGYKLVAKKPQRQWTSENEVGQRLAQRFQPTVTSQCRTAPELKSVAQIEKVIGKKEFESIMGDLVVKVSSGNTLVDDSDPRSPIIKTAAFSAITPQSLLG